MPFKIHGPVTVESKTKNATADSDSAVLPLSMGVDPNSAQKTANVLRPLRSSGAAEQSAAASESQVKTQTLRAVQLGTFPSSVQRSEQQQQKPQNEQLREMRDEFKKKLILFDEQLFEMHEWNDWLQNLKTSAERQQKQEDGKN
ncbi:unnamed protein product [Gongylonema pulchrum]|uniref:Uncharacterized protein n=1 Tax=Gongylonema pulchrum TaxID=637853 RepID=A0A3P6QYI4_9BILA|nr:unnamed protein product [Gongylonema pulchrum]